jgi:hypothetical protein
MARIWRILAPTPTCKNLVLPLGPTPLKPKDIRQAGVDQAVLYLLLTYAQVLGVVRRVLGDFSFNTDVCCITKNVLVSPVRCGPFQASMNIIENVCGCVDDWNLEAIVPLLFDVILNY